MDFKDYINELNSLENQEAKAELQTFYMLHASTFKFFKAIDNTIQELLKQPNVSKIAIEQLNGALPTLKKMRNQISKLDTTTFTSENKNKINDTIIFIKNAMELSKLEDTAQDFHNLLAKQEREKINNQEAHIKTLQDAEQFLKEIQDLDMCSWSTLKILAEQSSDEQILEELVNKCVNYEEYNDTSNDDFWEDKEFQPYIIMEKLTQNHYLTSNLFNILEEEMDLLRIELVKDSRTSVKMKIKLRNDSEIAMKQRIENIVQDATIEVERKYNNQNEGGCFVATACYGNYDAPEVLMLRKYRDEQLLTNWLGTLFVKFYYFISPPLAKQIEKSNKMKQFIRKYFLKPIVDNIQMKNRY